MYRALEFHDSQLLAVIPLESSTHLLLRGYIHQWEQTSEGWAGTGWTQQIRILIDDAKLLTRMSDLPADLSTGWIRSPGGAAPGLIRLPFQADGASFLFLEAFTGETTIVRGTRLSVVTEGEPAFVEKLPDVLLPANLPDDGHSMR